VRTTAHHEVIERPTQVAVETTQLSGRQAAGGPSGVETGPPQDLVGQKVPDAGDPSLVEQTRLQRLTAVGQCPPELGGGHDQRIDAENALVGVQLDTTEPPRITQPEITEIVEPQREAVPMLLVPVAGVLE
jgi:hypothetical protein